MAVASSLVLSAHISARATLITLPAWPACVATRAEEVVDLAVEAGADVLVAGSYIFRAGDAAEAVAALREAFPPEASPREKRWPWQR